MTLKITYANGSTREVGYYYDGGARLAAEDFITMRYSGVTRVTLTDRSGRVVIDQPIT